MTWCDCKPTECKGTGPCRWQAMRAHGWLGPGEVQALCDDLIKSQRDQLDAAVAARERTISHKEVRRIAYEELKQEFETS